MSQISMPVRILLIGAVVFLAAWFTVLRPKPASFDASVPASATPASTAQSGLGRAVDKAKAVAGKAVATATPATTTGTAPATAAATATPAPAAPAVDIPAETLAKLPTDVAGALKDRKVLVLGVFSDEAKPWRPVADDDRYVRNALRKTNRYDGDVFVKLLGISDLSTYGPLVNQLHVTQTPAVVVIGADLKGTVLTGYADRVALNQTIADVRRSSVSPTITDEYLRGANQLCGRYETRYTRWSRPTVRGAKAEKLSEKRIIAIIRQYRNEIARTPAPAQFRGFKSQWVKVMTMRLEFVSNLSKRQTAVFDTPAARKLDQRFDALGLTDCAWIRRS